MRFSRGARRLLFLIETFTRKYARPFFATQYWVAKHFKVSIRTVKYWYAELLSAKAIYQRRRANMSAEITILPRTVAPRIAPPLKEEPLVFNSPLESHPPDDGELIRKTAGLERLSEGDRRYLRELRRAGVDQQTIVAGVAVGTARKLSSSVLEPIRTLRYFARTIAEVPSLPMGYAAYVQNWLERKRYA